MKKNIRIFQASMIALCLSMIMGCGPKETIGPITITTEAVSEIAGTTAVCGGNITSDGGTPITEKGVCFSTSPNPTVEDNKTIYGFSGTGVYPTTMQGLTPNTTYHVRAYAYNGGPATYGNDITFKTGYDIGADFGGGKVAYIFKSTDAGYVAGEFHGLIAAPSDQSNAASWGCATSYIAGAMGQEIGTGMANTNAIVAACAEPGTAARLCADLVLGGYSDWYLPSASEVFQLTQNIDLIGGLTTGAYYSSSTQWDGGSMLGQVMYCCTQFGDVYSKSSPLRVRAMRTF